MVCPDFEILSHSHQVVSPFVECKHNCEQFFCRKFRNFALLSLETWIGMRLGAISPRPVPAITQRLSLPSLASASTRNLPFSVGIASNHFSSANNLFNSSKAFCCAFSPCPRIVSG